MDQFVHQAHVREPKKTVCKYLRAEAVYHVEDGLQDEVYVDHGGAGPVLHGPDPAVVAPQQGAGQLVQGGPLVLLGDGGH